MEIASRAERTEQMRRRCTGLLSAAFVQRRVAPLIGESAAGGCALQIVRMKGTRFTLRCSFPSGAVVYAKAYRGRLGPRLFATLKALWAAGFGDGPLRVPEPLAYIEDENIVLMREARGVPLSRVLADRPGQLPLSQVRAAARWLAALHGASLSDIEEEGPAERSKILKESDILADAAAVRPECAQILLEFLGYVHELAQACSPAPRLTPTHGQFTPSTVFIESGAVTAIDLDTFSASDPAKDVATFISKLKYRELFRCPGEPVRAGRLAAEFLDEYSSLSPGNLGNLHYYLALYCLKEFSKSISARTAAGTEERAHRLCRAELHRLLREGAPGRSLPGSGTPAARPAATALAAWSAILSASPPDNAPPLDSSGPDFAVVQAKETARLTLRLTSPSGASLYAKSYPDHLGRRCSKVSAALAAAGFCAGSAFRVPDVAAVVPDRTILIIEAAPGVALHTLLESGSSDEVLGGCRSAARWLSALHRSGVRIGRPEREWVSLKVFRIAGRLISACAATGARSHRLLDILYQLKHRAERLSAAASLVQTHGSYRPKHVFVSGGITTAIDLDRSVPADPAKDAAEFLADVRASGFDGLYDAALAETAADVFLDEYLLQAAHLAPRIACYTASYLALRLLKAASEAGASESSWPERFESYSRAIAALCAKDL